MKGGETMPTLPDGRVVFGDACEAHLSFRYTPDGGPGRSLPTPDHCNYAHQWRAEWSRYIEQGNSQEPWPGGWPWPDGNRCRFISHSRYEGARSAFYAGGLDMLIACHVWGPMDGTASQNPTFSWSSVESQPAAYCDDAWTSTVRVEQPQPRKGVSESMPIGTAPNDFEKSFVRKAETKVSTAVNAINGLAKLKSRPHKRTQVRIIIKELRDAVNAAEAALLGE